MAIYLLSFPAFLGKHLFGIFKLKKLPEATFTTNINFSFFGIGFGKTGTKVLKGIGLLLANILVIFMLTFIPIVFFILVSFFLKNVTDPSCHYETVGNTSRLVCSDDNTLHLEYEWNNLITFIRSIPSYIWMLAGLWHVIEIYVMMAVRKGWKSKYWGPAIGELITNWFGYLFAFFFAAPFHSLAAFFIFFWLVKFGLALIFALSETFSEKVLNLPPSIPEE